MRLLSVGIYVGILALIFVDLSFGLNWRKDENAIDVSEELNEQDSEAKIIARQFKKPSYNSDYDEDDEDEDDSDENYKDRTELFFVCGKNSKDSICKCEMETLNCEKGNLTFTHFFIRDGSFTVRYANFRNNQITVIKNRSILPGLDYQVEVLDFSNNFINKIQNKAFDGFKSLKKLYLSSNRLTTITNGYLTKNIGGTLHQLFLDNNQIKRVTPSAFKELKNLNKLVLDGNVGIQLSRKTFPQALAHLEMLSLDDCGISRLDDDVFEWLTSLKQLSLRNNPIAFIPKAINAIPNLYALDLSKTEIAELQTDQITNDHNLKELYLSNMPYLYGIVDCAFCGLPNLEKIDLSNSHNLYNINENAFGGITSEKYSKFSVATLKEFDIHGCDFKILPEKLFDWTKIENLKIHANPFNCGSSMDWLTKNKRIRFSVDPKCFMPPALSGMYFSNLTSPLDDAVSDVFRFSIKWATVIFLIFVGIVGLGSATLYYVYRIRGTAHPLNGPTKLGYSNLPIEQPEKYYFA